MMDEFVALHLAAVVNMLFQGWTSMMCFSLSEIFVLSACIWVTKNQKFNYAFNPQPGLLKGSLNKTKQNVLIDHYLDIGLLEV